MHLPATTYIFRLLLFLGFLVLIDLYAFQGIKTALNGFGWARYFKIGFWIFHAAYYIWVMYFFSGFLLGLKASPRFINFGVTTFAILYLPKLFIFAFVFIEDVYRGGRWLVENISNVFRGKSPIESSSGTLINRTEFIQRAGIMVAAIPFLGLLYGAVKGKYDYLVRTIKIPIKDLPDSFVGFKIAQISDLHSGSLDDSQEVERGIQIVNETQADVIVMTGDLVNNRTEEAIPFEEIFSRLSAPLGVYSILGNHDYGDYTRDWKEGEKQNNFQEMLNTHKRMGWKLLMDEHVVIEKGDKQLALIGVQNISGKQGFHSYGNLQKAFVGTESANVKILLSHDPSHWDKEVRTQFQDIALTLSGHTHGAQMGIEIPGFRFSPAQWIYKQWAGLYTEGSQHLNVNRGFGFIGYAGRAGIRPEISVLELVKA